MKCYGREDFALTLTLSQRERELKRPLHLGEGWGEGIHFGNTFSISGFPQQIP